MVKKLLIALAIVALFGCSQDQAPQATAQAESQSTATTQAGQQDAKYLLVFFINPHGGPCRMQADILNKMAAELDGKVLIRPVKTNVDADAKLFAAYGIRGLPTILLADRSGKEISRLSPGVHPPENIRRLLQLIPEG